MQSGFAPGKLVYDAGTTTQLWDPTLTTGNAVDLLGFWTEGL